MRRGALLLLVTLAATRPAWAGPSAQELARAEALFQEARQLMTAGHFAAACPKLAESLRLDPGAGGTMLNLGLCHEAAGQPVAAWRAFRAALAVARRDGRHDREAEAQRRLTVLARQLGFVVVLVPADVRGAGLEVQLDGAPVAPAAWGEELPVAIGSHRLIATAPGRAPRQVTVTVAAGQPTRVEIHPLDAVPTGPGDAAPTGPPDDITLRARRRPPSAFGAMLRADVQGLGRGVVAAPGLTYAWRRRVEVTVAALLGAKQGVWAGGTLFLLRGAWAPRLVLGMPLFFKDGAWPGVQGGAGLEWRPLPRLAFFVDVGVAYFPGVPAGYGKTVFLPAAGVIGRLH